MVTILLSLFSVSFLSVALSDPHHIVVSQNLSDSYLTLSELTENVSNYLDVNTETKFVLQQGNHILQAEIAIGNVSSVSFIGSGPPSSVIIKCEQQGRLLVDSIEYIEVSNLTFDNCRGHQITLVSQFMLKDCIFRNHVETAMAIDKSSGYITNTLFISNSANQSGGAMMLTQSNNVMVKNCTFWENKSANQSGGAMMLTQSNNTVIEKCTFRENNAESGGAIFAELHSTISVSDTVFEGNVIKCSNLSECFGGAIHIVNSSHLSASKCTFHNNSAYGYSNAKGGVVAVMNGNVYIQESVFAINRATDGGVMFSQHSRINISASTFRNNAAIHIGAVLHLDTTSLTTVDTTFKGNKAEQGIIYLVESACVFQGNTEISDNTGSLLMYYSNATFKGNTTFTSNNIANISTHFHKGGAVTAIRSRVIFQGQSNLSDNTAEYGGAIHAIASKLYNFIHSGTHIISNNRASESGGGVYLFLSELKCEFSCKIVITGNLAEKGGGACAIASIVTVVYGSLINFTENIANGHGGGIYLEVSAKLNILIVHEPARLNVDLEYSKHSLLFINNMAGEHGGAMYVADETESGTCNTTKSYSSASECFLQAIILSNSKMEQDVVFTNSTLVKFLNNRAQSRGSILFGGLLDRCTLSPFAQGQRGSKLFNTANSLQYFQFLSDIKNFSHISSRPVRVCFCKDSKPDCSYRLPPFRIQRGGTFQVSLVAVDQANRPISAKVQSFLSPNQGGSLGEQQYTQSTIDSCTNLSFTVASPLNNTIEEVVIYADGPCKDAIPSQSKIQIKFSECMCPTGFQSSSMETSRCICECDTKLTKYNRDTIAHCDFQTRTLEKVTNSWIGYSKSYGYNNYSGYLIHLHCPREYCKPPSVNFSFPDGADGQCKSHRSGLLCGTCFVDFSISLGSSNCIACPSHWPAQFIGICIIFFLSGILLVALLLALNLTVAMGTLNGIIFYANIAAVSKGTFLTFSKPNYITVFISWLNLDFGFDVCFIKNLDTYWKTWLQLAFPAYVIFLVVMVIVISQRSKKFSQLIGRKNPVATLATLIFLSYAKLLSIIIVGLSCTTLIYSGPEGEAGKQPNLPIVWLSDASVKCFHGRHLVLFIVAIFILLAGIVYTLLLFFWQWLLYLQNKICSSWTRVWILKLSLLIETYHAPYTPKHRYWTGLLLLVRYFCTLLLQLMYQVIQGLIF